MKTGLITGISGQGGAYLAKRLLAEGYKVVGTTRDSDQVNTKNLSSLGIDDQVTFMSLDLQNSQLVFDAVDQLRPDEIYHLAAPSSVAMSFKEPAETISRIALTNVNILDAIRKTDKDTPCFIATSTEMFGDCDSPVTINAPHYPKSPYGVGKSCAHYQARVYREAYGMYVCSGVFSNFESASRPIHYVTAKIVNAACDIALGERSEVKLGNLSIRRDWGSAEEYMLAAWLCLQQDKAGDYLIATGTTSSLEDFLQFAFGSLSLDYKDYLVSDDTLLRPLDIQQTMCDPSATHKTLNWRSQKKLPQIVAEMVQAELTSRVGVKEASKLLIGAASNPATRNRELVLS
jgi:GDPmannose 4,6-dehydratase